MFHTEEFAPMAFVAIMFIIALIVAMEVSL